MPTQEISLKVDPAMHDLLVAELAEIGFSTFTSEGELLRSYRPLPPAAGIPPDRERVRGMLASYGINDAPGYCIHDDRNWNADWEASIRAVRVGRFVIAPDWDLPKEKTDYVTIRINPKMSFGTGHHESTRLALLHLENLVVPGNKVLDAGTGTGILAIAAVKLGASEVVAIDTDASVEENLRENAHVNQVTGKIRFLPGSIDRVSGERFDVIVANINRNVLMECMSAFHQRLVASGYLILSGLLRSDRELIISAADAAGFVLAAERAEGGWWACGFRKTEEASV